MEAATHRHHVTTHLQHAAAGFLLEASEVVAALLVVDLVVEVARQVVAVVVADANMF